MEPKSSVSQRGAYALKKGNWNIFFSVGAGQLEYMYITLFSEFGSLLCTRGGKIGGHDPKEKKVGKR